MKSPKSTKTPKRKTLKKIAQAAILFSMSILTMIEASASESNSAEPQETDYSETSATVEITTAETTTVTTTEASTSPVFTEVPPDIHGNAELVEKEEVIFTNGTFEFISVTTKTGNVFYIFIRRDNEEGTANVFFLNKVDEWDLYTLIYPPSESDGEDGGESNIPEIERPGQTTAATETSESGVTGKPINTQSPKKSVVPMSGIVITIIAVVLVVGFLLYTKISGGKKKPGKKRVVHDEPDPDDTDEYEDAGDEVYVSDEE